MNELIEVFTYHQGSEVGENERWSFGGGGLEGL